MVEAMDGIRKRVLMLIPNLGMGGAQRSFAKVANWLCEEFEVKVVCFDKDDQTEYPFCTESTALGESSGAGILSKIFNAFKRIRQLRRIKKDWKPDISISFLEGADFLNILTNTNEPKVLSIRGSKRYDPHIKGLQGFIRRRILIPVLYSRSSLIISISKGVAHELKQDYPGLSKKIVTVFNGYKITPVSVKDIGKKHILLTWAGRFGDEKGLLEWCALFAKLQKGNEKLRLLLLGHGPMQESAESILNSSGLRLKRAQEFDNSVFDDVDVVICKAGSRYEEYLSKGDLFIFTSPSEGFGNVLIEAMQAGLPVLSADGKWGPREILAPEKSYNQQLSYPAYEKYGILLPNIVGRAIEEYYPAWEEALATIIANKSIMERYQNSLLECISRYNELTIKKNWISMVRFVVNKKTDVFKSPTQFAEASINQ
jgi:glycosyltransferase involved in cell wall biosynthesis